MLAPATIGAVILFAVSGPMITSGNADSVALGLEISTGVAALLGASYVARMVAPYSPSPKEAAFAGLLVAIAGFFSFSQNLVVDGFGEFIAELDCFHFLYLSKMARLILLFVLLNWCTHNTINQ